MTADLTSWTARAGGAQDTAPRPDAVALVSDLLDAGLPPMDVVGRADRLRERFDDLGCDALVVHDLANIRYLTGFTGSNAVVVVRGEDLVFVTDGRYTDQATAQLDAAGVDASLVITRETVDAIRSATMSVAPGRTARIGLEAGSVTWATQRALAAALTAELVPTVDGVEVLRTVKDLGERARLARAAAIADMALAEVRPLLTEGPSERAFARALEGAMAEHGSAAPSFETIVASGPNGARPHARPSDRLIGASGAPELVVLDFGATCDGYHSDMTRTLAIGDPTDDQARMLEVVAGAQAAGIAAVRSGAAAAVVDAACRDHIAAHGMADAFVHGTGHGTGVLIHEAPWIRAESDEILAEGNSITVEPGVYLPEHGGVRIEDSVIVTDDGCWALTRSPYSIEP